MGEALMKLEKIHKNPAVKVNGQIKESYQKHLDELRAYREQYLINRGKPAETITVKRHHMDALQTLKYAGDYSPNCIELFHDGVQYLCR